MFKSLGRVFKFRPRQIYIYEVARIGSTQPVNFEIFRMQKMRFSDEVTKAKLSRPDSSKETIFDKILSKEIKADIIFEDDKCLVFNDVSPQAPVHFLVIPKRRLQMLDSCTDNDADMLSHLILTAKNIAQKKLPDGYRLVINNGQHGAQSVYHLHIHILGGRQMRWPPG